MTYYPLPKAGPAGGRAQVDLRKTIKLYPSDAAAMPPMRAESRERTAAQFALAIQPAV